MREKRNLRIIKNMRVIELLDLFHFIFILFLSRVHSSLLFTGSRVLKMLHQARKRVIRPTYKLMKFS